MLKKLILTLMVGALLAMPSFAKQMISQVDTMKVATSRLDSAMTVTVAVPARYLSSLDETRYPVVYLLNGYSGGYNDYRSKMRLDSLANAHQVIFICPDGRDSWYWDSPVVPGMQMESFIVKDLLPAVDSNLRTIPSRDSRAIAGLSMGGHGALWLAMRHKDLFGSAGSMSGGVDIARKQFHKNWKMKNWLGEYASNPKRWKTHTVMSQVPTLKPGELNIIIECGDGDFFREVNDDLHAALLKRGIEHSFSITPGNHSWPYWRRTLPVMLDFFDGHLKH